MKLRTKILKAMEKYPTPLECLYGIAEAKELASELADMESEGIIVSHDIITPYGPSVQYERVKTKKPHR